MNLFNKINLNNKKYSFWLRFFQMPKERPSTDLKLDGYSNAKIEKFWKLSSILQHAILKSWIVVGAITLSLGENAY